MIFTILAFFFIITGILLLLDNNLRNGKYGKYIIILSSILIGLGSIYFLYKLYQYFSSTSSQDEYTECNMETISSIGCSNMDNFYKKCLPKMPEGSSLYNQFQVRNAGCMVNQNYVNEGLKSEFNSCEDAIGDLWSWNAKNKTKGEGCKNQMRHKKSIAEAMCNYYKEDRNKFIPRINSFEEDRLCL